MRSVIRFVGVSTSVDDDSGLGRGVYRYEVINSGLGRGFHCYEVINSGLGRGFHRYEVILNLTLTLTQILA